MKKQSPTKVSPSRQIKINKNASFNSNSSLFEEEEIRESFKIQNIKPASKYQSQYVVGESLTPEINNNNRNNKEMQVIVLGDYRAYMMSRMSDS